MKLLTTALILLCASTAHAGPITNGQWSAVTSSNNDSNPFYDNKSWDCDTCNIGFQMQGEGIEYLSGNWRVPYTVSITRLGGTSDYSSSHVFSHNSDGSFTLDNGHGYTASSLHMGAVLFRKNFGTYIRYWYGFEDLPYWWTDGDYQDDTGTWIETIYIPIPPTKPVSEPNLLLLFGFSLFAIAKKVKQ